MLIDDFLPSCHVASHHELLVRAPADRAYEAIWQADLGASFAVKVLLALRAVPALLSERRFLPPGMARAVWSFVVSERGADSSLVETETRVACGDEASVKHFRRYWSVVGPFSGFIRTRMLSAIRAAAETS
jgi:hypothetical protein